MNPAGATPAPPVVYGDYRLGEEIGRGALGAVHLAHDVRSGRRVAVKTMALADGLSREAHDEARWRFTREMLAAQRLHHPDIVAVHAGGEHAGRFWLAMDYAGGTTLVAHTRPEALLPVAAALEVGARLALALGYAHSRGVVHRDLKPANVIVEFDGEHGIRQLKLADFGVSRLDDGHNTRTGVLLGTVHYLSPDVLAGAPADARSDFHALGVLVYQLLTGHLPFQGDSLGALMAAIGRGDAVDPRALRPGLADAAAEACAIALRRPPGAVELARLLRAAAPPPAG